MSDPRLSEQLALELAPDAYDEIRSAWLKHSRGEEARDLGAVMETLVVDCVYEVVPLGQRWEGHEGARAFYREMFEALPDVKFTVTDIVIGPQGAFQISNLQGTQQGFWGGLPPTDRPLDLNVLIFMAWDRVAKKFRGERVWFQ